MFVRISSLVSLWLTAVILAAPTIAEADGSLGVSMEAAPVANPSRGAGAGRCDDIVSCAVQCLEETGAVTGAVTDGETKLTLTVARTDGKPLDPGTVRMFLDDGFQPPEDGGFGEIGSDDRLAEVTVSIQDGIAQAQFFTPEDFNGSVSEYQRLVTWSAEYTPDGGGDPITGSGFELELFRPALVLTHGLWSSQDTWDMGLYFPEITFRVDYSDTNAHSFDRNQDKAAQGILNACEGLRRQRGIAMRQIDFAGHSMGGILGRYFEAAHEGYINKLFTLNTPHTGSPLANLLIEVRGELNFFAQQAMDWVLDGAGFPVNNGAIHDLQKNSAALNAMGATSIPSHALAGTGGSDLLVDNQYAGFVGVLIDALIVAQVIDEEDDPRIYLDCPFQGAKHDFIVGLCSQQGGCSASSQFGGLKSIHTAVTGAPAYADRIKELLNDPTDSDEFGNFPAPASVGSGWERPDCFDTILDLLPGIVTGTGQQQMRGTEEPRVQILEPAPGTVFAPLDDLTVTIGPIGDFPMEVGAVVISAFGETHSWTEPPFTHTFFIPGDFAGELEINALGNGSQGPSEAEPVTVFVDPDFGLEEIWIASDDPQVMVGPGDNRQISVQGLYSDEVVRNITHSSTGTTYQSADPNIVQVTEDGLLIPQDVVEDSETTITVSNDGHEATMTAIVLGVPLDDIFDDRFQFGQ